jgi:hypothetical protein
MQGIIFDKSYRAVLEARLISMCVRPRTNKAILTGDPIIIAVEDVAGEPYPLFYATAVLVLPMTIGANNVHICNRDLKPKEVEYLTRGCGYPDIQSFLSYHLQEADTFSGSLVTFQ